MKVLLGLFLSLLLASCTVKTTGGGSTATEVEGNWVPACTGDDRMSVAFAGGTAVFTATLYDGTGCATVKATAAYTHTFTLGAAVRVGEKKFDYVQVSALVTLKTAAAVTEFNTGVLCGYSDWALNQPKDIAGKTCGSDVQAVNGVTKYSIYKLDTGVAPNELKIGVKGSGNDGTTVALRHTALTNAYFKQ